MSKHFSKIIILSASLAVFALGANFVGAEPAGNPPIITSLNPPSVAAGSQGVNLTINGSNFASASVVTWQLANSSFTQTNYLAINYAANNSDVRITVIIPDSYITNPGVFNIRVVNPNGDISAPAQFTVTATNNQNGFIKIIKNITGTANANWTFNFNIYPPPPGTSNPSASIFTSNNSGMTTVSVPANSYAIKEIQQSGWSFNSAPTQSFCKIINPDGTTTPTGSISTGPVDGDGFNSITVEPGKTTECTFSNNSNSPSITAGLIVNKVVVGGPNGVPAPVSAFNLTVHNRQTDAISTVISGATNQFPDGDYDVYEIYTAAQYPNYIASFPEFNSDGSLNDCEMLSVPFHGYVTMVPGGSYQCTIVNTYIATATCSIDPTINALTDPIPGLMPSSTPVPSSGNDFPFTVNGTGFIQGGSQVMFNNTYIPTSFVNTTRLTASIPSYLIGNPGSFPVAVANPQSFYPCTDVSNIVPFTITGAAATTTLKLIKSVQNLGGGTKTPGDWTLTASGPTGFSHVGNYTGFDNVTPGIYTLSESVVPNYSAGSWVCTGAPASALVGNSISIASGQNVVCTIINTYHSTTGSIKVKKTIPLTSNSSVTNATFSYTIIPSPSTSSTFTINTNRGQTNSYTINNLPFDIYTITENNLFTCTNPPAWGWCVTPSPVCTVSVSSATIIPECNFTNTLNLTPPPPPTTGTITVSKTKGGSLSPTTTIFAFTSNVPGSSNFTIDVGAGLTMGNRTLLGVPFGTYTITETTTGWITTGSPCTVTVSATNLNPTCPVVNSPMPPAQGTLKIIKETTGGDGTFDFTIFPTPSAMSVTTVNGTSAINNPADTLSLAPGTYSVDESTQSGWDLTTSSCTNGTPNAAVIVAGQTTTCTFTNAQNTTAQQGTLKVIKNTIGGDGIFGFTVNGPNNFGPLNFSITTTNGSSPVPFIQNNLEPGEYTITETTPNTGSWNWDWDQTGCVLTQNSQPPVGCGEPTSNNGTTTLVHFHIQANSTTQLTFHNTKTSTNTTPQGTRWCDYCSQ
ncbi:MAG: hypothetical protein A3F47_01970 [Candidatus Staskawiczbacteria bacterium RIFCSPHIGHO2_12_FULL_38_11]|uniref:IPT/TIG domain-containing protein n=1 Tax=Candidatus Staskawiczbacteria bacterium RIFCSPHIGHO2_12_FULL_38_11 TaxID=1802209 RepID=A0A1G2I525_9BACT|nr:MAG: hypothetical protein A3F47_01970 [Candidatus Staskawiczbacteria bacterium RIFCSPHIGHO2_12_FULL_38_11]